MTAETASLERLVESGLLTLESLHPGGLQLSGELATECAITADTHVLDVASGTGETACWLAETLNARVTGIDHSDELIARARAKAEARGLAATFERGDARALPFGDDTFDVAICECTLCLLDKAAVLREMARVVRPGGRVGMHDLFWHSSATDATRQRLLDLEGEAPETLDGWQRVFTEAGLAGIRTVDRSAVKARWMRDARRDLGLTGQLGLSWAVVRRWGIRGLWRVLRAEQVFASPELGYAIVVGTKP